MKTTARFVLPGFILSSTLLLIACGGGGGGAGTPSAIPPATGSVLFVSGGSANAVLSYNNASGVSGGVAPNRTLSGAATSLNAPRGIAVDLARNQLYIANSAGNSILIYAGARAANGDSAPTRVISGGATTLSAPSRLYLDIAADRLYVANTGANSILVFDNASTRNGAAVPSRSIAGAATLLTAPSGAAVDPTRNLLYVANGDGRVLVYANAAAANGAPAPVRILSNVQLNGAGALYVDPVGDLLYVSNANANTILIFDSASTANGAGAPQRTLFGPGSMLNQPRDLFVDLATDRLYVANTGGQNVLVFNSASTVNGSPTPNRVLTLANGTGPEGISVDVTPMILTSTAALDGEVSFDGTVATVNTGAGARTGDTEVFPGRSTHRQFFSFSLPSTASGASVVAAELRLHQASATINGIGNSPYVELGSLVVDHVDYGTGLDGLDYNGGTLVSNSGVLATDTVLEYKTLNVASRVQADLTAVRGRSQFRLRFSNEFANQNTFDDFVRFADGDSWPATNRPPQLVVTFQP